MHILKAHANISADTDADADGICIIVYASNSYLFVRVYKWQYILFSISSTNA